MRTAQSNWEAFCLNLLDEQFPPAMVVKLRQAFAIGLMCGVNMGVEVCANPDDGASIMKSALDKIHQDVTELVSQS